MNQVRKGSERKFLSQSGVCKTKEQKINRISPDCGLPQKRLDMFSRAFKHLSN
jgi:hypothetical protein